MRHIQEKTKAIGWLIMSALAAMALWGAFAFAAWPLAQLDATVHRYGLSWPVLQAWAAHMREVYLPLDGGGRPAAWLMLLWRWGQQWLAAPAGPPPLHITGSLAAAGLFAWLAWRNPHDFVLTSHGSARWMTLRWLHRYQLFSPTGFILGNFKGRWVRNWETLSLILLAPPGTGKTVQLATNVLADWPSQVTSYRRLGAGAGLVGLGALAAWAAAATGAYVAAGLYLLAGGGPGLYLMARGARTPAPYPTPSMVINDVKGELYSITAGWRSRQGPTFKLAWGDAEGDCWNPLDLLNFPNGEVAPQVRLRLRYRLQGLFRLEGQKIQQDDPDLPPEAAAQYDKVEGEAADVALAGLIRQRRNGGPRWWEAILRDPTILGAALEKERLVPAKPLEEIRATLEHWQREPLEGRTLHEDLYDYMVFQAELQTAIDAQMALLIPDTIEAHWRNTGRAAGAGFALFHIEQSVRLNRTPSYGALLDWLTQVTVSGTFADMLAEKEIVRTEEGEVKVVYSVPQVGSGGPAGATGGDVDDDKVAAFLEDAIREARVYGYSDRVISELNDLVRKPDKERGSVISTFGSGIAIFKNPNVRERTSRSTVRIADLRGITVDGVQRPVTVYIVVPLKSAEALGRVTALFCDMAANYWLSEPEHTAKKNRPIIFLYDEFWSMPKMDSTQKLVTLGRGQRCQLYLVGQSFGQIGLQYGAQGQLAVDVMRDAMAYTIVPTQASQETAQRISKMVGEATFKQSSIRHGGLSLSAWSGGGDKTVNLQGMPLIRDQDVLGLEKLDPKKGMKGQQYVLVYGLYYRPILARPPVWFWDRKLKKRGGLPVKDWNLQLAPAAPKHIIEDEGAIAAAANDTAAAPADEAEAKPAAAAGGGLQLRLVRNPAAPAEDEIL